MSDSRDRYRDRSDYVGDPDTDYVCRVYLRNKSSQKIRLTVGDSRLHAGLRPEARAHNGRGRTPGYRNQRYAPVQRLVFFGAVQPLIISILVASRLPDFS